ncbi:hypothetical protein [Alkalicoccobacillus murimartini]|uniref:Uncharacterized protein n=1 Tax=Alkalicoccobacillus murimartini TaxID=171685 RepID=A0ABT9YKK8_9BACI|nr:hypothetical protein [Alkalicoccobacillus murimartini]MDQ0208405.1 hypothetical protein [Alkalicoccobacillus murimartini]
MNIQLLVFFHSSDHSKQELMGKTYESDIRPIIGDIIHDPGFHSKFHNGYEVVKVTLDYSNNECLVSLSPLVVELQEITFEEYAEHLREHGWSSIKKDVRLGN